MPDIIKKALEFMGRIWATIQVWLSRDGETPFDRRRRRVQARFDDYQRRKEVSTFSVPVLRRRKTESNWRFEPIALKRAITKASTDQFIDAWRLRERQFYKVELAPAPFVDKSDVLAYVDATEKSAMVFTFEPHSKVEPYKAYWVFEDEAHRLVEQETLDFAKRIFDSYFA